MRKISGEKREIDIYFTGDNLLCKLGDVRGGLNFAAYL